MPISIDECPEKLESWHSVETILSDRWDKREKDGLLKSASRNRWHQHAIDLVCNHLQLSGLAFLQLEFACLDPIQIQVAHRAIEKFIPACQHGIPELAPELEKEGSIWFLKHYFEGGEEKKFTANQITKAFADSRVVSEIEGFSDSGYNSLVEFFSFLKSVRAILETCLSQNRNLLYVQPQP